MSSRRLARRSDAGVERGVLGWWLGLKVCRRVGLVAGDPGERANQLLMEVGVLWPRALALGSRVLLEDGGMPAVLEEGGTGGAGGQLRGRQAFHALNVGGLGGRAYLLNGSILGKGQEKLNTLN